MFRNYGKLLLAVLLAAALLLCGCGRKKPVSEGSNFEAYFLDVGSGDAAFVICDGHAMLIDGGLPEYSDLIFSFIREHGINSLDLIIATHPHADHVGGLSGALTAVPAKELLCPVSSYDSKAFKSLLRYASLRDLEPRRPEVGEVFDLGSARVTVLAPASVTSDHNNSSIVVRVEYGKTSFLFTGDMEREEELALLESGAALASTCLKVGHHGSGNATCYPFLREVSPEIAVISVGNPNAYSHPHESVLSRLRDCGAAVYRTDLQGQILIRSDGSSLTVVPSRNAEADTLSPGYTPEPSH